MKNIPQVLFLLHLPPPVHGSSMVGSFIKKSIHINETFKCSFINLLASENVSDTGKLITKKIIGFIITLIKILKHLIKFKTDACYLALSTTGVAFLKDTIIIFILKKFKVKRIYHLHNKGVNLQKNNLLYCVCYKFVFKDADVILLSKHLYDDIKTFVPMSKIYICPNGIPDNTKYEINRNLVDTNKDFNILFLSNLIESKGVYVLMDACKLLMDKGLKFNCYLVGGEGDITQELILKKINFLGLNNIVVYVGKKYGDDKTDYFKKASVFVFPTYYRNETFGLVNLEAMQYSLPIISTFEGGIPDVVEDNITGFLVPQRNIDKLAEKLEFFINNIDKAKEMGRLGRKKYEDFFTLEKFESRLTSIINSII